ncbi:hypothetical protein FQN60_018116, partial [Etheostoma spectabile]
SEAYTSAVCVSGPVDPEKSPSWERIDGAQRVLGLSFVDISHFFSGKLFHGLKQAAGRERAQTAAPVETTNALNTATEKQCATVTPTVRKPETAARTTSVLMKLAHRRMEEAAPVLSSPAVASGSSHFSRKTYCCLYLRYTRAAIDCVVGSWGPWSSCTSPCGVGSTERSRQVSVPPRNGGTPCPDLKQRRGCFGNNAICSAAKEVAKILPDSFKRNFKDPWRRPHMLMKEEKASYCVYLRVKQASAACKLKLWSAQLVKERLVCAECQSDAMSKSDRCGGDGLESIRTFWAAASVPGCHGSWVKESSSVGCRCPPYSVLFV